jgi:hypothetical protein
MKRTFDEFSDVEHISSSIVPTMMVLPTFLIAHIAKFIGPKPKPAPKQFLHRIEVSWDIDMYIPIKIDYFYDSNRDLEGFYYISHRFERTRTFTWFLKMPFNDMIVTFQDMCIWEDIDMDIDEFYKFYKSLLKF